MPDVDEEKLGDCLVGRGLQVQRAVLLTNKLLELAGFPRWSRRWPHRGWRSVDWLFNRLTGKPTFLCMLAAKTGRA